MPSSSGMHPRAVTPQSGLPTKAALVLIGLSGGGITSSAGSPTPRGPPSAALSRSDSELHPTSSAAAPTVERAIRAVKGRRVLRKTILGERLRSEGSPSTIKDYAH